jgi:ribosomal protein S18 acetylase RimI-like enzyme
VLHQCGAFAPAELRLATELIDEFLDHPERGDYRFLGAWLNGTELAGYICFGPIPLTDRCCDVYWIAVDGKHARRGIGSTLLERMEEDLGKEGTRRIYIETSSTPPYEAARHFYQAHGYRVAAVLEDFYRKTDDKIIFAKDVRTP